jgi:hypothetical protein
MFLFETLIIIVWICIEAFAIAGFFSTGNQSSRRIRRPASEHYGLVYPSGSHGMYLGLAPHAFDPSLFYPKQNIPNAERLSYTPCGWPSFNWLLRSSCQKKPLPLP